MKYRKCGVHRGGISCYVHRLYRNTRKKTSLIQSFISSWLTSFKPPSALTPKIDSLFMHHMASSFIPCSRHEVLHSETEVLRLFVVHPLQNPKQNIKKAGNGRLNTQSQFSTQFQQFLLIDTSTLNKVDQSWTFMKLFVPWISMRASVAMKV